MLDAHFFIDDVVIVGAGFLVIIVSEALTWEVGARVRRSTLLLPLFEAAVHDSDVGGAEVAQHPDGSSHGDTPIGVIADDSVCLSNLELPHVGFENLTAGQGLSVVGACRDDIIYSKLLRRFSQSIITILLVSHVPPGAEDAELGVVLLDELLDITCFDQDVSDGQDFEGFFLFQVLERLKPLKGRVFAFLDRRLLLVGEHLAVA